MADERLRGLERRWKETKAVEDEARYLRERCRVGELASDSLRMLACLSYPAASIALGDDDLCIPVSFTERYNFLEEGEDHQIRFLIAALQQLIVEFEATFPEQGETVAADMRQALVYIEDYLIEESEIAAEGLEEHMNAIEAILADVVIVGFLNRQQGLVSSEVLGSNIVRYIQNAIVLLTDMGLPCTLPEIDFQLVYGDFVPWLLGDADLVRERVEARRRSLIQVEVEEEVEDVMEGEIL